MGSAGSAAATRLALGMAVAAAVTAAGLALRTRAAPTVPRPPYVGAGASGGRIVLLLAGGLDPWDVDPRRTPWLAGLDGHGAYGLMNVLTAGPGTADDAYATLGAGARARAPAGAGEPPPAAGTRPDGGLVVPVAALQTANADLDHPVHAGAVGDAADEAGACTAAFGNADVPGWGVRARQAPLAVMDGAGRVARARVDRTALLRDPTVPGGWRLDPDAALRWLARLPADCRVVAIQFGDLERLEAVRERYGDAAWQAARRAAVLRLDRFAAALWQRLDPSRDLLLVVSPTPSAAGRRAGLNLTPFSLAGAGVSPGLATSATTRTPGVVAATDVAPTVYAFLGRPPDPASTGRPVAAWPAPDAPGRVARLFAAVWANRLRRVVLYKALAVAELAFVVVVSGSLLAGWPPARGLAWSARTMAAVPGAFLVLAADPAAGPARAGAEVAAATAAAAWLAHRAARRWRVEPLALVGMGTAAAVTLDVLRGSPWMAASPLGFSPNAGARFYGIGNEYMGVAEGAALVGVTAALDRWGGTRAARAAAVALLAALAAVVVWPAAGAKFGGAAGAWLGFGTAAVRLFRPRLTWRHAAAFAAGYAAAGALLLWGDAAGGDASSHMGQLARSVAAFGWSALERVAKRKEAMNLKLFRYTPWSWALVACLASFAALTRRPAGLYRRAARRRPHLAAGLEGVAVAALVNLAANDAGVVAAATTMIYGSAALAAVLLEERAGGDAPIRAAGKEDMGGAPRKDAPVWGDG